MKVEVAVLGSPVLNNPYGLCGRQATLNFRKRGKREEGRESEGGDEGVGGEKRRKNRDGGFEAQRERERWGVVGGGGGGENSNSKVYFTRTVVSIKT